MSGFTFICPECGKELVAGVHDFDAHAISHWNTPRRDTNSVRNPTARARAEAIFAAADAAAASLLVAPETPVESGDIEIIGGDL